MKLPFSPRAVLELEEIGDYIARDNPGRASSFIDEIAAHCSRIVEMPSAFPAREDIASGLQMAVHGNYLYPFPCPVKDCSYRTNYSRSEENSVGCRYRSRNPNPVFSAISCEAAQR